MAQSFGPPFFFTLKKLFTQLFSSCSYVFHYAPCKYVKHCQTSYPVSLNKSESIFYVVHSDVWGPAPTVSLSGFKYFVTFVGDYSQVTWVYLLKSKSDVFSTFV